MIRQDLKQLIVTIIYGAQAHCLPSIFFISMTTPYYLLEESKLRRNLSLIRSIAERANVEFILAFKAFALWRTFPLNFCWV